MMYKVAVVSNSRVLEMIEFDRPCITRKEFKVILESLRFNSLHYGNGLTVSYVYCNDVFIFDVCACLVGQNTLDLRIHRYAGRYRSMLYRYLNIK